MGLNRTWVENTVLGAKQALTRAAALQQFRRRDFVAAVTGEIARMRQALTPTQSAAKADDDLRDAAQRRVMAARVAEARDATAAAVSAANTARQTLSKARAEARRVTVPDVGVTVEEDGFLMRGDKLLLVELRQLNRALARADVARRLERVTVAEDLFGLLQEAEAAGDALLAAAADEQLDTRLAVPPSTPEALTMDKELRARVEAHRDGRLDPETRGVLAGSQAAFGDLEKGLRSARDLQSAIDEAHARGIASGRPDIGVRIVEDAA